MERTAAVQLIDKAFNQHFEPKLFTWFIKNLFNDIDESKSFRVGRAHIQKAFSEHIVSYKRLASYTDPQGETLDILAVKLAKESALDRARTMQRNFIASYLKKRGEKDAAVVAYFHPDSPDWRFSYVKMEYRTEEAENGKVRVKEEFTPACRYSFLVGVNEPNHTARRQLVPLLQSNEKPSLYKLELAFSIEPVTKEFFGKYKQLFLDLKDELDKTIAHDAKIEAEFADRNINTANFAKKLLGQIVFLYFLQKKGWLGVGKDEDGSLKPWGSGPKNFLKKLFDGGITSYNNFFNDILEPLFYEALAVEHDNNFYSRFNCRIPFLNGGLFEPMHGYNWQETDILIDNKVFEEIFSVFNDYNFTVREDEPLEREVAVDPEMLGKVFENLLEVKDRKSKGAFYTPREIVHYMCQESLVNYLAEVLPGIDEADLDEFIRRGDIYLDFIRARMREGYYQDGSKELPPSIRDHVVELDELLAKIKICDPAIGSGAFTVGMMNEIVRARLLLEEYLKHDRTAYQFKRHCIQESIYGVDIDAGAIDIAKLRLWLSLVVDEDDFSTIKPLPNLDYKIMQGNSLLEEFEGVRIFNAKLLTGPAPDNDAALATLKEQESKLSREYIHLHQGDALTKEKKYLLDRDLKKIQKSMKKLRQPQRNNGSYQPGLFSTSENKADLLKKLHDDFFVATRKADKERLRQEIEEVTFELIRLTLKEQGREDALARIELAVRTNTRPFFLWQLNFSEVFQEKGGFDVVLGNPPYVRADRSEDHLVLRKAILDSKQYKTLWEKWDLYVPFIEKGYKLLRDGGTTTMIVSDAYCHSKYAQKSQKWFLKNSRVLRLDFFSKIQLFDAGVRNITYFFQKTDGSRNKPERRVHEPTFGNVTCLATDEQRNLDCRAFFPEDSGKDIKINTFSLSRLCYITKGMVVNANERVVKGAFKMNDLVAEKRDNIHSRPFVEGKHIGKWLVPFHKWLEWGTNRAPSLFSRPTFPEIYTIKEKILVQRSPGPDPKACYDSLGLHFTESSVGFINWHLLKGIRNRSIRKSARYQNEKTARTETPNREKLEELSKKFAVKYLLAVMNSSVARNLLRDHRRSNIHLYPNDWKQLLVPNITKPSQLPFEILVDYILSLKGIDLKLQFTYFEQLIDAMVFELYFPAELKTAGKEIIKHLGELKPITDDMTEEEKMAIIQSEFDRLYEPGHPVRNNLETLDSVEEVRIIKEAVQK